MSRSMASTWPALIGPLSSTRIGRQAVAARGVAFLHAGRKLHLADHVAAVVGQELDDSPVAALDAGELPGLARPLDRFLGEDAMLLW